MADPSFADPRIEEEGHAAAHRRAGTVVVGRRDRPPECTVDANLWLDEVRHASGQLSPIARDASRAAVGPGARERQRGPNRRRRLNTHAATDEPGAAREEPRRGKHAGRPLADFQAHWHADCVRPRPGLAPGPPHRALRSLADAASPPCAGHNAILLLMYDADASWASCRRRCRRYAGTLATEIGGEAHGRFDDGNIDFAQIGARPSHDRQGQRHRSRRKKTRVVEPRKGRRASRRARRRAWQRTAAWRRALVPVPLAVTLALCVKGNGDGEPGGTCHHQ